LTVPFSVCIFGAVKTVPYIAATPVIAGLTRNLSDTAILDSGAQAGMTLVSFV